MEGKEAEYFGAAAHQLKSPISIIQWCLQTALESPDLKGHDRDMVVKAVRQADAMGQLVMELSHLFKLTNRSLAINMTRLDLGELAATTLAQCALDAERAGVRLLSGPIENAVAVMADESLLRQAIVNLLNNAIKYSDSGSTVEIEVGVHKSKAFVSVRDHGIGIAPAEQDQIFVEFYRGAQARAHAPEGTGLGLALGQRIVHEFGGDISLESHPGKGSLFTITLPAA